MTAIKSTSNSLSYATNSFLCLTEYKSTFQVRRPKSWVEPQLYWTREMNERVKVEIERRIEWKEVDVSTKRGRPGYEENLKCVAVRLLADFTSFGHWCLADG